MDKGKDFFVAVSEAFRENRYQLVSSILAKVASKDKLRKTSSKKENLLHIFAQNAHGCSSDLVEDLYDTLIDAGVNPMATDS